VVDDLISFKSDIPSFKEKLKKVNTDKNHEIQQVIKGLLGMTSIIEKNIQLLREKNSELETISKTDRLTGVSNRMHLDNVLASELSRSKRYDNRLSLIMLDIDHFKKINDTYGHQVGDKVLIQLSEILKINTRDTDTVGRWGGEEFMIVCPEISQDQAFVIAEKILTILNQSKICDISVTASFGISQLRDEDSVEQLVKRADENLYKAKHSGRNCIFPKLKIL
jgi:diguanylate cyclase (GGDEF)-like protein